MADVLVTGASGLVGRAVLAGLQARGLTVRALSRDPARGAARWASVEWVGGDLLDPPTLSGLARGTRVAIHLAGAMPADPEACLALNHGGTVSLLAQARAAGVERFVMTSSTAVYGDGTLDAVDEDAPARGDGGYARSKRLAEQAVWSAGASGGPAGAVVRPCMITGAGDANLSPPLFALVAAPDVPLPGGGLARHDLVDAADVAWALLRLAADGAGGPGPYNLTSGAPVSLRTLLETAARVAGTTPRFVEPDLQRARRANADAARQGRPPPVPPVLLDLAGHERTYAIGRARAELGYAPRSDLEDLLRRARPG